jgi:hypothetical protein
LLGFWLFGLLGFLSSLHLTKSGEITTLEAHIDINELAGEKDSYGIDVFVREIKEEDKKSR